MKPVLVGLDNPHSSDPAMALFPAPQGCTGWRIWKMISERTGCSAQEYSDAFDRRNVCDMRLFDDWFADGSTVILLGEEVRRWFDLPKLLISPQVRDGVIYRQVPHPSGRCHFYNDPVQRALVSLMFAELYQGGR